MKARQLFSKPPTPDQKRAAQVAAAQAHVNVLLGARGTGKKDIAPAPAARLVQDSGPFAGAQSQAAPEALGLTKLLWRT